MRKLEIVAASAAADLAGFASNVTGATWAVTATNSADGLAHKVTIRNDSSTNHSAKTITLTGTAPNGAAQTETLAAPGSSATVTSTKYFLTLTGVTVSATIGADTMDIGWAADSVSPPVYTAKNVNPFSIGFGCTVTAGTPNFTVQHTYDDSAWFNHSVVAAKTANTDGSYTAPVAAIRLLFAAAGSVTLTGYQTL